MHHACGVWKFSMPLFEKLRQFLLVLWSKRCQGQAALAAVVADKPHRCLDRNGIDFAEQQINQWLKLCLQGGCRVKIAI